MNDKTVEVPRKWLERLIELGKKTTVRAYTTGLYGAVHVEDSDLSRLKGYIQSAESLLTEVEEERTDE